MATAETITILFTDLVGSTELAVRVGDQRADAIRREHFAALTAAAAATRGEVVKNLGDGLMIAYRAASDALDGAVALQHSVARHAGRIGEPLSMRIGISTGDASYDDGDWFGTPVVEAARMCAAADPGQILVNDVTLAVGGSRLDLDVEPVGERHLKGLPDPLRCSSVAWTVDEAVAPAELPAALDVTAPMVGRDGELAALLDAWNDARAGHRRSVLVGAEAGMGKTRLVSALAARAHADGAVVLLGRCIPELGVPFLPWREVARQVAERFDAYTITEWVGASSEALARILPERHAEIVPGSVSAGSASSERSALFEAASDLLRGVSSLAPVLLVLEDLHWADPGSVQMLRHLLAERADLPALIVATYRPAEIERGHPLSALLADLRRDERAARVELGGLDPAATSHVVRDVVSVELPAATVRAIWTATDGNPFFVREVARHLDLDRVTGTVAGAGTTAPAVAPDGTASPIVLPQSIREVVENRLERVDPDTQRMLGAAAVVGREFSVDVLSAVTGTPPERLLDALDDAIDAGVVSEVRGEVGRFAFTEAVTRAALVDSLTDARRVRLHSRVVDVLERLAPDDYVALAFHAAEAAPVLGAEAAVQHGTKAADRAATTLAFEDAVALARRTLAFVPADDERARAELLVRLAECEGALGRSDQSHRAAIEAADLARRNNWIALLVRAVDAYGLSGGFMVVDETLMRLADEVARLLPRGDSAVRVKVLANLAVWSAVGDPFRSYTDVSEEALAMARRLDDRPSIFHAATVHAFTLTGLGRVDERLRLCEEALANEPDRSSWLALNPRLPRAVALLASGDRSGFVAALDDLDRWADRNHHARMSIAAATGRAVLAHLDGRLDEAVTQLDGELADSADPVAITSRVSFGMYMDAERGRFERALPMLEGLASLENVPSARADLAACYAHLGRTGEAAELLAGFAGERWRTVPWNWARPATLYSLVETCTLLGDGDTAASLLPVLAPYDGLLLVSYVGQICSGAGASAIGRLHAVRGNAALAIDALRAGLALEERVGARPAAARSRAWLARALLLDGSPAARDEARALLQRALSDAREMQMESVAADAESLLA